MKLNYKTVTFALPGILLLMPLSHAEKNPLPYQCPKNPTTETLQISAFEKIPSLKAAPGKMIASADDFLQEGNKIILKGKVVVTNGLVSITANDAVIDKDKQQLEAKGGLHFTSELLEISSQYLSLNLKENTLLTKDASYLLKGQSLRGETRQLEIEKSGKLTMDEASFTSCPPDNEVWAIKAGNITIDPDKGRGTATNMTLRIQDIPVLYLPYIQFPASSKRLSGMLIPTFGNSERNGQEISIPLYWNIAENYDATITPRYLSDRGTQYETEFRYLTELNSGTVEAEYLGSDTKASGDIPSKRYRFKLQHHSQFSEHLQANIDFEDISDNNYFFDFGGNLASSSIIEITRQANIQYQRQNWGVSLLVSDDKTLNTIEEPYKRLPQIRWQSHYPFDNASALLDFNGEFTVFDRENAITAKRLVMVPEFSYPLDWAGGYIHPTLKYNYRSYSQKDPLGIVTLESDFSTPIFSIDAGTYLERNISYGKQTFLQTLEPRLYYLNVPTRDQQNIQLYDSTLATVSYQRLFQDNRYTGYDRIGDANQLSVGVSSRVLDENGKELLRFGMGQAYYFEDREVSLQATGQSSNPLLAIAENLTTSTSPLLADLQINIADRWRLNSTLEWQPDTNRTESASFKFQYRANELDVANMGHRRRRLSSGDAIEQVDFSFSWGVHRNWRLIGRWNRDISNDRNIETLFGAEYDSCCWAIRIVNRKHLNIPLDALGVPIGGFNNQYDSGVSIQFVLKGLSSLGSTGFLNNSIEGFRDPYTQSKSH